MAGKLRKADRVRWRLLPEETRRRLEALAKIRDIKLSTALRVLARRFDGDVEAYERSWYTCRKDGRTYGKRMVSGVELGELIDSDIVRREILGVKDPR